MFALYWIGVFAAGDAKLLWALGLSMPPAFLKGTGTLAAFVVGVNSFVPYGATLMESAEGERLFLDNIGRTQTLGVSSSPTLAVDGFTYAQAVYTKNESACGSRQPMEA